MTLKNIVYLSSEQFTELKTNGSILHNGIPIYDSPDNDYRVPDTTAEQIADMQATIALHSAKVDDFQKFIDNLTLETNYPVGSRYVQFPDEPTPAERFGGQWVLDEDAMDKFLVGAGNLYALGATGGSAEVTLTEEQMPNHTHDITSVGAGGIVAYNADSEGDRWGIELGTAGGYKSTVNYSYHYIAYNTGGNQPHNNLPPYLAVNIWKRTA